MLENAKILSNFQILCFGNKRKVTFVTVLFLLEINEVVSPVVSNDLVFLGWSQFVLAQPITIGQLLKMQGVIISRFTPHHPSSSAGQ